MKIYLVRHAESERNRGKEHDKLSDTGIEQAKRLGLFLKDKHIDQVYCSTMTRTKETLKFALENFKISTNKIKYVNDIVEQDQGIFMNKPSKEYYYHIMKLKDEGVDLSNYKVGETGESFLDVEKRAQRFIDYLKENYQNKDHILLVSHGMFLRLFVLRLLKLPIEEMKYFGIHNASLSTFELDKNFNVKDFEIDDYKHLLKYSSYDREVVEKV